MSSSSLYLGLLIDPLDDDDDGLDDDPPQIPETQHHQYHRLSVPHVFAPQSIVTHHVTPQPPHPPHPHVTPSSFATTTRFTGHGTSGSASGASGATMNRATAAARPEKVGQVNCQLRGHGKVTERSQRGQGTRRQFEVGV